MKQRWSAYEFHHITYLPDKWGEVLPDCELHENGVVVVVMDKVKHPAGDKVICRRTSDPDGTTFGTKDLRTMSHWISAFIMIYYYLINKF